jgi:hyperosmotically inducible protein
MNPLMQRMSIPALVLALAAAAGCDRPQTPETAGQKIDRAAETAGQKVDRAADTVGQKADAAGQKMDRAADTAGQKIDRAMEKTGDKLESAADKTGLAIDDATITTKIKSAFVAEPSLSALDISVETNKGVVTLTGTVESATASDRARQIAAGTQGVSKVNNKIAVKKS